jgi:hypothetical protein
MQGRWFGHSIEQHFIGVAVFERKLEVRLDGLAQRTGFAHCGKQFTPRLKAQSPQNIVAVPVSLVHRGCGGACCLRHGAHGERLFAAARPQPGRCAENSLFQIRIGMPGHVALQDSKIIP